MQNVIDATGFGYVVVSGTRYDHDVVLTPKGKVVKRQKKLSKQVHGSSHVVAREELERYLEGKECSLLVIGTGQYGALALSEEAEAYLADRGTPCEARPTPEAIELFNKASGKRRALVHVTC